MQQSCAQRTGTQALCARLLWTEDSWTAAVCETPVDRGQLDSSCVQQSCVQSSCAQDWLSVLPYFGRVLALTERCR